MSCKYINKYPSASALCLARNEPKADCAEFLLTAFQNLKEKIYDVLKEKE